MKDTITIKPWMTEVTKNKKELLVLAFIDKYKLKQFQLTTELAKLLKTDVMSVTELIMKMHYKHLIQLDLTTKKFTIHPTLLKLFGEYDYDEE